MDEFSEDERNVVYHNGSSKPLGQNRFTLDDAFADSDDNEDVSFEFSPAAIRQEMAKNMKGHWGADQDLNGVAAKIGYAGDPDASVSTFDINGSVHGEPISLSPPQQPPPLPITPQLSRSESDSFHDIQLTSGFSSISLSDHPSPPEPRHDTPEYPYHEPSPEPVSMYAAVQIDVSQDHPEPQVVTIDTNPTTEPSTATSDHFPKIPSSSSIVQSPRSSVSTPSLPMTASTSATTPTTAQSNASTVSAGSRHRSTRSMGPSALDKVLSKTRPKHLPPKDKREDSKHMADWEVMMKKSRAAGMFRCICTDVYI